MKKKKKLVIRNLPNITPLREPGGKARPNGWYPKAKTARRADGRRLPPRTTTTPVGRRV